MGKTEILGAGIGSEIKLWSLRQSTMLSSPCPNASRIELACGTGSVHEPHEQNSNMACLRGHHASVEDIALVPDGLLVSVSLDTTMRAWRTDDFSCAAIYRFAILVHFT